jgi:hypothetical protein
MFASFFDYPACPGLKPTVPDDFPVSYDSGVMDQFDSSGASGEERPRFCILIRPAFMH